MVYVNCAFFSLLEVYPVQYMIMQDMILFSDNVLQTTFMGMYVNKIARC